MENILTGTKIEKSFGDDPKVTILDKVDIEIKQGDFVAIMGPSGCGKTTLLFALSGTDTIDQGSIECEGIRLTGMKERRLADLRREKFGFIFQQPTMLKNLNLLDNILLPVLQNSQKNKADNLSRAKALMQKTGIIELAERETTKVSGGQLQRAGICRALMSQPAILFADEPTGALNSKAAEEIMTLLTTINQEGTAVLLVTHDAKVAAKAKRVLFMKDGKIMTELNIDSSLEEERVEQVLSAMKANGV
ncbi:ABC transporter ATP-binding protein [Candidatus Enterococcus ferrettii]|uniref:ABC transporter domain-containing protein n=1 Tax=Candidatus Enterococcus ferrettii TaxID=2815324 RepID=A0ABV0EXH4_9ENTE|nr:ABC transporter ATP-binding protein [Enterococcus sp. 665A]MBO1341668.1 ABC transporter ATP-binding protein [Enterococcus sp. 665A]